MLRQRRRCRVAVEQVDDERIELVGQAAGGGGVTGAVELAGQRLQPLLAVALAGGVVERLPVGLADAFALAVGQLASRLRTRAGHHQPRQHQLGRVHRPRRGGIDRGRGATATRAPRGSDRASSAKLTGRAAADLRTDHTYQLGSEEHVRKLGVAGLVAGALLVVAPAASADVGLTGGATSLKLARGTANALASLGVEGHTDRPRPGAEGAGRSSRSPEAASIPRPAAGMIRHGGGLRLRAGRTRVALADYRSRRRPPDPTCRPRWVARVCTSRAAREPTGDARGFKTNVRGLTAQLTARPHALSTRRSGSRRSNGACPSAASR